jgi:putative membrane protein
MLAVMLAILTAPFGPPAGPAPAAPFDDAAFLKAVAIGGMYDGHLSYLVGAQSKNGALRDFAAAVVADRIIASQGLKEAAKGAGVELPTELDEGHRKRYDAFKEYKGPDLDRDFVTTMAERHALAVVLFTRASKDAKNPTVRAFATEALPKIRERMQEARKLAK